MTEPKKLLVATNNPGKMRELRELLQSLRLVLVTPEEAGLPLDVPEDGRSYRENAIKKAKAFSEASALIALADDSGLEVDTLDGAPGLHSKRYLSVEAATDPQRRAFLLQNLKGKPRPWSARFRSAVAIAMPTGIVHWTEGECEGEIVPEERGSGGFGYDPVFLVAGTGRTMAELDLEEKNQISHRARAVQKALPILARVFNL